MYEIICKKKRFILIWLNVARLEFNLDKYQFKYINVTVITDTFLRIIWYSFVSF